MEQLHTPAYNGTTNWDEVYEPAEDTFLLLDAIESHAKALQAASYTICAEVGCGAGLVITALSQILPEARLIATDINPKAIDVASDTARRNHAKVEFHLGSFLDMIQPSIDAKIDVLVFNPPYVVTPSEEVGGEGVMAAWAGGVDGREVIDQFMPRARRYLSAYGRLYLVVIQENLRLGKDDDLMAIWPDYKCTIVKERRAGPERLKILCYEKRVSNE